MADSIVTFDDPPVVEVVASVRFTPMRPENGLSLGQAWRDLWASNFPAFDLQPPYFAPTEAFTPGGPHAPGGIGVEVTSLPPPARAWMSSSDGQHLLQLQHDWFAVNWRRQAVPGEGHDYDRWPTRLATFQSHWKALYAWLAERGESPMASQFEVTYINHIRVVPGVWEAHGDISAVFPGISFRPNAPARLENLDLKARLEIAGADDLPPARLHLNITPGFVRAGAEPEPEPIFALELTVRGGAPRDGSFEEFGNRARSVIVRTFDQITSPAMHKVWRKQ